MTLEKATLILATTVLLSSCASIKSIEKPSSADGLVYFLPNKDILITITVDKNSGVSGVDIGTTPAYPDTTTLYLLKHSRNAFGKNTLDVGVTQSGLLTSTKSITVSSVNEAFKNLAASAGSIKTFSMLDPLNPIKTGPSECKEGRHTFIFKPNGSNSEEKIACGLQVSISKMIPSDNHSGHSQEKGKAASGIYYRQSEPYGVEVRGSGIFASSIVFSPNTSKTFFLPISRTFFANNEASFELTDGMPARYRQDADSELLSLSKLPADAIGAYFSAIGQTFDSIKTTDSKEAAALSESIKLELARRKYEACIEAIKVNDNDRIKSLGC